jgi:cytoskeleton protein RodZ
MAKITRLTLDNGGGLERRRLHLREISDDGDAPLETVGQDLRNARQRKGEDLAQISRVLKIRKVHLDALEESNFAALPGRAYAIGFVRSYAEYLGLNGREYVDRLKAEIAGRSEARDAVQVSTPHERKLPPGGVAIALLLLILVVWGIYTMFVWANRMAAPPVTPVPARLSAQVGLAPPPPPPPEVPAAAPVTNTAPAAPSAPPSDTNTVLPPGTKYGAQNVGSRITLLAHRPTRVTVLGQDGKLFLDRLLQPGDSYLVPNQVGLTLSTSDGGALEVVLDGSPRGYAGKEGATAEALPLNPRDIADRQARAGGSQTAQGPSRP